MNLFRKMAQVISSFWTPESTSRHFVGAGMASWSGESVTERTALSLAAVWSCVNLLSGLQASMPLHVFRTARDGSREIDDSNPIGDLLRSAPNADQSAFEFWQFLTAALELRGNAYALMHRNVVGGLVALEPIENQVYVSRAVSGGLQYEFTQHGKSYKLGADQIFHLRGFMPTLLGGLSTLEYARHTFGAASAAERFASEMFRNGLRPSGVLQFKDFLSAEHREIAESKLAEKFSGVANAGRPMVLEGGSEWRPLSITPADSQMLESRVHSVEEVCRYFGTPPFMIGHTQKTTSFGAGVEQQTIGFVKWTLQPRLKRIESAAARRLLSSAERLAGVQVEFALEGLLRGDSKARSEFYRTMVMIGAMTINEVRALENLPPVDGGDVSRVQMQNVPLTQVDALAAVDATPAGAAP